KEAWGDRPIYFAATTNSHSRLGLDPYAVRQGVAFRLSTPEELEQPGIYTFPPNGRYTSVFGNVIDIERTSTLLWETFEHHDLINKAHWVDGSTRGIPTYYGWAHLALATALNDTGAAQELVERNMRQVEGWMALADR